ncbi:unnamed protein product [Lathyrus sativus]|nr:unnamed protein product [Lathyrus sativus]
MWIEPPEVKPVVKLLKQTLVGTGASLVTGVMLFIFATPVENFLRSTFTTEESKSTLQTTKVNRFNLKEKLLKLPAGVKADDKLAVAAADVANGRPVYLSYFEVGYQGGNSEASVVNEWWVEGKRRGL